MNVAQLLHKLIVVPNVEIVVAFLPEMHSVTEQAPRYSLLLDPSTSLGISAAGSDAAKRLNLSASASAYGCRWLSQRGFPLKPKSGLSGPPAKHRRRRCGCAGLHSVRWLAPSCMGPWYPLAENRGEWGSLDRGSARS
jgi:hypothetical protein